MKIPPKARCRIPAAALLLLLLSLPWPAPARITVGIIGDQFGVKGRVGTPEFEQNKDAAYKALAKGVAALNRSGPMDTVLHLGDLTESTQAPAVIAADFVRAATILDRLDSASRPGWFLAPGDHDVNPVEWVQNSRDRSRETHFISLYKAVNPRIDPPGGSRLFYSFDVKGYHFISLYSHDHLRSDPRWGNIYLARVSDRQLAWLEKDLEQARGCRGVVVFTHQPLWYSPSAWSRVHRLLARHKTLTVIAGHYHYDQNDHVSDGIQYRVVGALGGHVKTANADSGGWWHATRLTVEDDGRLNWQLIPVKGGPKARFTSRWDMDRVQALDYALGSASRNLSGQAVYVRDGRLTDSTGKGPAIVTLTGLGNPVNQVVSARITIPNTSEYTFAASRFEPGICENAGDNAGKTLCRVIPGANIASSNTATVRPACARYAPDFSQCLEFAPFWRGEIVHKGNQVPRPGDRIPVTLSLAFTSDTSGRQMEIRQEALVPVMAFPGE